MNKLLILQGIPASGKSTYAHNWVAEDPTHRVRYNWDDRRNSMGPYWVLERENTSFLKKDRDFFLNFWMEKGWDIVIDNMNLNPKDIEYYEQLVVNHNASNNNYIIEYKLFSTPVEECIRRDSMRSNPIGEKTIKQIWNRYKHGIILEEQRKFSESILSNNNGKPFAIIVDLDATIALNLQGRPFYGDGCAEKIHEDTPIYPIIHIIENYNGQVIFLTGREGTPEIRKETINWVKKNVCLSSEPIFIFRPIGDYSPGVECKKKTYLEQIKPFYNIEFVLEDNSKVVKMYRDLNLLVLQPNDGKF